MDPDGPVLHDSATQLPERSAAAEYQYESASGVN